MITPRIGIFLGVTAAVLFLALLTAGIATNANGQELGAEALELTSDRATPEPMIGGAAILILPEDDTGESYLAPGDVDFEEYSNVHPVLEGDENYNDTCASGCH